MPTKVFVSYSHDSEQHSQRVLALANQLRRQGIDAELDQYETRPPQGWPRWCDEQLRPENSEHVLVICTEMYVNRIEGKVPADEGRGVFWEGSVIYSCLYDQKSNERFIPIFFDSTDEKYIPRPLNGTTRYRIATFDLSDTGYNALYRELTHQPAVEKPPLGDIVELRRGFDVRGEEEDEIKILPPVVPRKVRSTFSSPTAAEIPPAVAKLDRSRRLLFDTLSRIAIRGPLPFWDRLGFKPLYSSILVPEKRVFRDYLAACREATELCLTERFILTKYLNVAEWESVEVPTLEFIAICLLLGDPKEKIAANRYAQTAEEKVREFARQQGGNEGSDGDQVAAETLRLIREQEEKLLREREAWLSTQR